MTVLHKASLKDKGGTSVVFDFNPTSLSVERQSSSSHRVNGTDMQYTVVEGMVTKLRLSEVLFEGAQTRAKVQQLEKWLSPVTVLRELIPYNPARDPAGAGIVEKVLSPQGEAAPAEGGLQVRLLPQLTFTWGPSMTREVEIDALQATYTRFTAEGEPRRAKVTLTLHVLGDPSASASSNAADAQAATFVQGQNLQSLAATSCGSPADWRRVAQANGIEDPLRVRPGASLVVPARARSVGPR